MGSHSVGLGDDTDARTFEAEDNRVGGLDGLEYDLLIETFIQSDAHDTLPQSPSLGDFTSQPMNSEEIPKLDNRAHFKALKLLNTIVKKMEFLKMTPEERSEWINFELEE
ncbi:hypothetical protein FNV43_RR11047 [Rhamnella rubrinervis]|uniref:At2g29880-like C-terminal domain-containing protein n=1 Tax=Rhamnella rubrinervis TaxID=2594499 RepID=A0A8K0H531_9ROSA|nr:hypothetical protein FNV43_RR11047 [Rhamnella rubrinervis]